MGVTSDGRKMMEADGRRKMVALGDADDPFLVGLLARCSGPELAR